ncbi:copper resistance CopC family protein, partial [Nakamurella sp.]|uniref:copper resistance CopC family protein n=1 Tax=Nakamurella sp. TaxID=1869182 RepID=UPI003B3BCC91
MSGLAVVMVPAAVSIAVSIALSIAAAPAAWAHSTLISSSPAADSVLATAPTRIELVFNEQIRDFQPKIAITVGDHDPIEVTPVVDGPTVTADLTGVTWPTDGGTGSGTASGTAGGTVGAVAWKVGYRVVSADGHPVSGLVPFSVGSGAATASGGITS